MVQGSSVPLVLSHYTMYEHYSCRVNKLVCLDRISLILMGHSGVNFFFKFIKIISKVAVRCEHVKGHEKCDVFIWRELSS